LVVQSMSVEGAFIKTCPNRQVAGPVALAQVPSHRWLLTGRKMPIMRPEHQLLSALRLLMQPSDITSHRFITKATRLIRSDALDAIELCMLHDDSRFLYSQRKRLG